jgi:hypothetical protein
MQCKKSEGFRTNDSEPYSNYNMDYINVFILFFFEKKRPQLPLSLLEFPLSILRGETEAGCVGIETERQHLYFCTSKASRLRTCDGIETECQYLYFCTSKASRLSTCVGMNIDGVRSYIQALLRLY